MTNLKTIVLSSMMGNIIEWYDVFIFSTGALYISKAFLPSKVTPTIALLDVFLILALGFITRPLGASLFGNFGDKLGRKRMLIVTLSLTGTSSGLIGLLPTYANIGFISLILLSALRILLGIGLGGEWGGGLLLIAENINRRTPFYVSFFQSSVSIGLILGSLVFLTLDTLLPSSEMYSFGWRIGFLLSFLLLVIGLVIRLKIGETIMFEKAIKNGEILEKPGIELFKNHFERVILGILIVGGLAVYFLGSVSIPNLYEFNKIISPIQYFYGIMSFGITDILFVFIGGILSLNWKKVIILAIIGNFLGILILYPAFLLKTSFNYFLFQTLLGISHGIMYSPVAIILVKLFPTNVRFSGISASYQFAGAFLGGIEPYVITWLSTFNYLLYPIYQILLCIISIGISIIIYKYNLATYFESEVEKR
jgi:MHS family shikimate/dehydroshikimate transporter-like MFS transporter